MNAPVLVRCPQCGSEACGPIRCRFTMIENAQATPAPEKPRCLYFKATCECGQRGLCVEAA